MNPIQFLIVFIITLLGLLVVNTLVRILAFKMDESLPKEVVPCERHSWVVNEQTGQMVCAVCPKIAGIE